MPYNALSALIIVIQTLIIFLAGLRPRPLGRTERTLWREAKGFLVCGLGGKPLPNLSSRLA